MLRFKKLSVISFLAQDPCSKDLIAYYKFDRSFRDVCNGHNAVQNGHVVLATSSGVSNGAALFKGSSKLTVASLNGYSWGSQFSVSLWFKRTGQKENYQGIINNGYYSYGSWEIRMGRENYGQRIGCGVVTSNSPTTWNYITTASINHWHHVVMTYGNATLNFYLDNQKQSGNSKCCKGNLISKNNDVVIGQAGHGMAREFFYGYLDEVKLFKKALTADEVTQLYRLKHV